MNNTPDPILDMDAFNSFAELMGENLSMIITRYIETADEYVKTMDSAFEKNDYNAIFTAAHTLKSSSMQIGAVRLGNIAQEIEQLTKATPPDITKLKLLIEKIIQAKEETKKALLDKDNRKI